MNITYLLGAGASYNAVPIVGEIEFAFKELAERFKEYKLSKGLEIDDSFYVLMMEAFRETSIYGTIDTYAKKLSLTNDKRLSKIKTVLSLFFTIWQNVDDVKNIISSDSFSKRRLVVAEEGKTEIFKKIDHRYFGLLTNYLKNENGKVILPDNIKFISWNYDLQLENTIMKLTNSPNLNGVINEFSFPNIGSAYSKQSFVHLNGIAGIHDNNNKCYLLNDIFKPNLTLNELFEVLAFIANDNTVMNDNYLTYAWEQDDISKTSISYAAKIMSETEIFIIVGYSFPTFNDEIDKFLFESLHKSSKFRKIYFQDPNASLELLKSRFDIKESKVEVIKDVKQFYLPLGLPKLNTFRVY